MATIDIDIDDETLGRARATALGRGKRLADLVARFVATVGHDTTSVLLPPEAEAPVLFMARHGGRDQIEQLLGRSSWDAYERPVPSYIFGAARAWGGLILDVGANSGYYALLAALAGAGNRVVAFEPDPAIAGLLSLNIALNGLEERISVETLAITDAVGERDLFLPTREHGMVETSASLDRWFKRRHGSVSRVPATTVDEYRARSDHAGGPVSLIKLSVEGHEAEALEGASGVAARDRPIILIDVLESADLGALSAWIARHGYLDVALRPDSAAARITTTYDGRAWTHALVPPEKLLTFLSAGRLSA